MSATGKSKKEKKSDYFDKLIGLLEQYNKILLVSCDNIGSNHMQKIRISIRGKAVLLMGKNTMMRRAIRQNLNRNPQWEVLLPHIKGNIGFVFTNFDLVETKNLLLGSRVPAVAKANAVAPDDVVVPKGPTTLEPTKTSFLQALNIATKINRGTIEILNDLVLIKKGDKVGSSEAALLQMLDIKPFSYGLIITQIYDGGAVYGLEVLDMTDADILGRFMAGLGRLTALSLGAHFPTVTTFPHVVLNAYKNLLAVALGTDYVFEQASKLKSMVENPDAFKVVAPVQAAPPPAAAAADKKEEPKKKEKEKPVEKEESEESGDMGFDLFG